MASRASQGSSPPAEQPVRAEQAAPRYAPVTWRAVLLGLFGAVCVTALQVATKVAPHNVILPFQSALTLLSGPIFWLFLLAGLNMGLRRWLPGAALRPAEFAVIYGIATVAAGIAAQDEVMQVFPMFVYPFRATQAESMGPFRQYIPTWLVPQDASVAEPYYLGYGTF